MTFARFLSVQIICVALDAFVTWLFASQTGAPILLGRTIGALSASVFAVVYLRQTGILAEMGHFIATSVTLISLLVSFCMFTLLVLRNPILQWPLAFAASAVAALLLSFIGYLRARRLNP